MTRHISAVPAPAALTPADSPEATGSQVRSSEVQQQSDDVVADAAPGPTEEPTEPAAGLTEQDQQILDFERQWWKYAGAKEQAIKELFDMSATRYYQRLNALIDTDGALEHDPMLVKRLRRMRASRQRARTARRLGVEA